ncbi:MAG TPA: CxC ATPase DNA modification system associated small protein [Nitrososphaera sp.]|jgi:hypothetical protein|nr:CxC ATPase DNA modification system associated small protein [Nitrososphaera sp.]
MALDEIVASAISSSVKDHNQNSKVSKRLVTWLNQVVEGNSSIDSPDDYSRHLEAVLDVVQLDEDEE